MGRCGCNNTCACSVVAGTGATVTGTGSAADPYVISAGSSGFQALDSATVDHTLTGAGTAGNPYSLTSAVKLSPAAGQLLIADANGLLITCEAVQDCVGAALGNGLTYDDALNRITARLSADAGNAMSIGGDGGLYSAGGGGGGGLTQVTTADTSCIDLSGNGTAGTPLSAAPILDAAAGNLLTCTGTGLRAAVSVGCGLTGTGAAGSPLTADTSGTWPLTDRTGMAFPCPEANTLSETYCAPDGIRTRPESTSLLDRIQGSESPGTTLNAGQSRDFLSTQSITNLSTCRQMHMLGVTRHDWDLSIQPGTQWRVSATVATEENVAGGTNILYRGRWEDPIMRWQFTGTQVGRTLGIAPGATITYNVRMRVECLVGTLTVNQQQVEGRYHGTTV